MFWKEVGWLVGFLVLSRLLHFPRGLVEAFLACWILLLKVQLALLCTSPKPQPGTRRYPKGRSRTVRKQLRASTVEELRSRISDVVASVERLPKGCSYEDMRAWRLAWRAVQKAKARVNLLEFSDQPSHRQGFADNIPVQRKRRRHRKPKKALITLATEAVALAEDAQGNFLTLFSEHDVAGCPQCCERFGALAHHEQWHE